MIHVATKRLFDALILKTVFISQILERSRKKKTVGNLVHEILKLTTIISQLMEFMSQREIRWRRKVKLKRL